MGSAILAGVGFFMAGATPTVVGPTIFFGLAVGIGMGIGYAAPTPAAVKWFGPHKRGLISGIVVSGFGLAPAYIAPLTTTLLSNYGIPRIYVNNLKSTLRAIIHMSFFKIQLSPIG